VEEWKAATLEMVVERRRRERERGRRRGPLAGRILLAAGRCDAGTIMVPVLIVKGVWRA
jgi:hypothetical protein